MPDLPAPVAKRLQRPSWRDPRLAVGLLLILASTLLGARIVAAADDTVPTYAARTDLKPGDRLEASTLVRVDVQLGAGASAYLDGSAGPPTEGFALREVRAGELVPRSAVGGAGQVGVQPVTVQADALSASALVVGSVVDVYVSRRDVAATQDRYADPVLMLGRVSVSWLPSTPERFGGVGSTSAVQVLVPTGSVAELLAAMDSESRVALVPVPGSARKGGS